ncbi:Hypothetical protein A7982_09326 [Minicystis rosea]|nr:Hypothetical protein A7982_09326 [Minicystis rosea]
MPANKTISDKPIDQLTKAEIDERKALTLHHLEEARKLWPGLLHMSEAERKQSPGKVLSVFAKPLGLLFAVLTPKKGEERSALAKAFDVLGEKDGGQDPERFETELLDTRLHRAEAQQEIVDALDALSRHMADDILDTGEKIMGPGLLALQLARTVAEASPAHASVLAPVLDAFRGLTKQARKAREQKREDAANNGAAKPGDK